MPAAPGSVLVQGEEINAVPPEEQCIYRNGVSKLLHHMKWSRPEIKNAVSELCSFASRAMPGHLKVMHRVMHYIVSTPNHFRVFKPNGKWNSSKDFEFEIIGYVDSECAKCPDTRKSVGGSTLTLNSSVILDKSKKASLVALSVTEAELVQATCTAQARHAVCHAYCRVVGTKGQETNDVVHGQQRGQRSGQQLEHQWLNPSHAHLQYFTLRPKVGIIDCHEVV